MSYVDLNPIRAGMATTLEESEYTSIRKRIPRHVFGEHILSGDDIGHADTPHA